MAHFYLIESLASAEVGATVTLEGAEAKHAVSVSRVRVGEVLSVGNGAGLIVTGPVASASPTRLDLTVESLARVDPPATTITLVQALAKGGRDESAVQAATELGIDEVVPWSAARSIVRWDAAKREKGRERWHSIAREATKQSIRPFLPVVSPLESTREVAARAATALVLVLEPTAPVALTEVEVGERDVVLVVGPEGGIAQEELDRFAEAGAVAVRLGSSVLRTSTAGPAALAVLNSALRRW